MLVMLYFMIYRPQKKQEKKDAAIDVYKRQALQDIRNVIGRRWPAAKLLLCPVNVQGFEAAQDVYKRQAGMRAPKAATISRVISAVPSRISTVTGDWTLARSRRSFTFRFRCV